MTNGNAIFDPDNIFPTCNAVGLKIDGDRRTIQDLTDATPTLTVALGQLPRWSIVWFGVENIAKQQSHLTAR